MSTNIKATHVRLDELTPQRKTVHVNGKAITSVTMAFESGFKAALRGASITVCTYKNPLMITAFERGYRKAKENK